MKYLKNVQEMSYVSKILFEFANTSSTSSVQKIFAIRPKSIGAFCLLILYFVV